MNYLIRILIRIQQWRIDRVARQRRQIFQAQRIFDAHFPLVYGADVHSDN